MTAAAASALDLFVSERAPGTSRLELLVPGVTCAGCIRKVEGAVRALPAVTHARVNFTTRRLAVEWEAGRLAPQAVVDALDAAGFETRPFAAAEADAAAATPASRRLLRAMAVAGFAAMNIMLLSISVWSGAEAATRNLFHVISALIAIPAVIYAGQPFFSSAWSALRRGRTNMDVPISIGVVLATAMSLYETLTHGPHAYFDGVTMLLFFLLVGRYLDSVMRDRVRSGVTQLLKQTPRGAEVLGPDDSSEWRRIEEIAPGMRVIVPAGGRLPVDGVVESGRSAIDRSLVTGESLPEPAAPGTAVLAGTLNLDAALTVRTTATGDRSFLAEVVRLMEAAEQGRGAYVRIADRASRLYAPAVHMTALLTCVGWLLAGESLHVSLTIAITVLIITCPCALGLAVPAVQVVAAGALMRRGILVKDGGALERIAETNLAVLDKTGTITLGRPVPARDLPLSAEDLALAAGLARQSSHPLSRALATAAAAAGITPTKLTDVRETPGSGLEAELAGERLRLGRPDWVGADAPIAPGQLALAFRRGDAAATLIAFDDRLRPDAAAAIVRLTALGLAPRILSGDRVEAVRTVAAETGISAWAAAQSPADKLAAIRALAAEGARVLVVGDGLNDGPALAAGHASMAPASASDVGQTAADLVFLNDSLAAVPEAVAIARRARRRIRENFALAIGYNILAVPIAVAGFATPLIAALAMSASSLVVVANALRLRWASGA